jgi:hypothetical protein
MGHISYIVAFPAGDEETLQAAYRAYNKTLLARYLQNQRPGETEQDLATYIEEEGHLNGDIPVVPETEDILYTGDFLASSIEDLEILDEELQDLDEMDAFFDEGAGYNDFAQAVKLFHPGPIGALEETDTEYSQGRFNRDLRKTDDGWCWVIGGHFRD